MIIMDTNKEYINMCEKAEEIQLMFQWKREDYVCPKTSRSPKSITIFGRWVYSSMYRAKLRNLYIWLPRQDQLQEMIYWKEPYGTYNYSPIGFIDWTSCHCSY